MDERTWSENLAFPDRKSHDILEHGSLLHGSVQKARSAAKVGTNRLEPSGRFELMDDTDRAEVKEFFRYGGFLRGYDYPRTNVPLLSYSREQAIGEVCGRR